MSHRQLSSRESSIVRCVAGGRVKLRTRGMAHAQNRGASHGKKRTPKELASLCAHAPPQSSHVLPGAMRRGVQIDASTSRQPQSENELASHLLADIGTVGSGGGECVSGEAMEADGVAVVGASRLCVKAYALPDALSPPVARGVPWRRAPGPACSRLSSFSYVLLRLSSADTSSSSDVSEPMRPSAPGRSPASPRERTTLRIGIGVSLGVGGAGGDGVGGGAGVGSVGAAVGGSSKNALTASRDHVIISGRMGTSSANSSALRSSSSWKLIGPAAGRELAGRPAARARGAEPPPSGKEPEVGSAPARPSGLSEGLAPLPAFRVSSSQWTIWPLFKSI
mmetsp:Transcript_20676/g.35355  ORF Transcript_20676/g.35355 Transcript_20676/m.35355 type:complete len:337 (-) Transcript_20676:343-1353(-)